MARRDRVPRHKGHTYKRNKNPKLSPFQREQKRARLANQAPTAKSQGSDRDIPHSQRRLYEYLQARQERAEARRCAKADDDATTTPQAGCETVCGVASRRPQHGNAVAMAGAMPSAQPSTRMPAGTSHATVLPITMLPASCSAQPMASLNEELLRDLAPVKTPRALDTSCTAAGQDVESVVARKKARKHAKKQEARRQRVAARLASVDRELAELTHKRGSTLRRGKSGEEASGEHDGTFNRAFERELRRMQKSEAAASAEAAKASAAQATRSRRRRRSSTHGDNVALVKNEVVQEATSVAAPPARASEFYELVDVVRYGERVEAPPTFDKLPDPRAAVSRLAEQLAGPSARRHAAPSDDRYRLLSSGGGLGEQRRLARLGLATRSAASIGVTKTTSTSHTASSRRGSTPQSAAARKEMELLREQVMAAYQRNKRNAIAEKKGVDLRHVFPRFS